ncbi:hypothetical protein [Frankia sp. EI5c]|uniref:hypothetical protein n=1 Tax=Frankia sp. EI5c TaxID=683316 RepID=UPI000FF8868C|nr:hypothetical protein [Frankia sp. EI5c]
MPASRPAPPISGPVEMTSASIAAARAAELARGQAAAAAGPPAPRHQDIVRGGDRGTRPPTGRLSPEQGRPRGRHAGPDQPRPQGSPWSAQAAEQRRPISVDDSWAGVGRDPVPRPAGTRGGPGPDMARGPADLGGPGSGGSGPSPARPGQRPPQSPPGEQATNAEVEAVARAWLSRKDSVLDGIDVI